MEDSGDDRKDDKPRMPTPDVGEEFKNVTIIATGTKKDGSVGDGIFKAPGGFVIIVMGAKKGDVVSIKVRKVFEKFAFAEIIKS